jgi:hypothetical protein
LRCRWLRTLVPSPEPVYSNRRTCEAGIDGLSIDAIELYERNMIEELALRLVPAELPVGS